MTEAKRFQNIIDELNGIIKEYYRVLDIIHTGNTMTLFILHNEEVSRTSVIKRNINITILIPKKQMRGLIEFESHGQRHRKRMNHEECIYFMKVLKLFPKFEKYFSKE